MKVILKPTGMKFISGGRNEGKTVAAEVAKDIDKDALAGVPYGMLTMVDEVQNRYEDPVPMIQVSRTLQCLIEGHGWKPLGSWGFLMKGAKEVQLGNVLAHGLPRGYGYSIADIARFVEVVTGETVKADTIRKTMGRLVQQERFERVDQGVFEKTHKGF